MTGESDEVSLPAGGGSGGYGPFSTLGLTVVTLLLSAGIQTGVVAVAVEMARRRTPGVRAEELTERIIWDGAVFSTFVILSSVLCTAAIGLWIRLRRRALSAGGAGIQAKAGDGVGFREYLGLDRVPSLRDWGLGAGALLVFWGIVSLLPLFFDQTETPEYMRRVYDSASHRPLVLGMLYLGVAGVGPFFEEALFRGFLYRGIVVGGRSHAFLRPWFAISSGALFWSVIHLQYGHYEILQIFVLGIALGWARWRTASLWVPIGMHALINGLALFGVAQGN